MDVYKQRISWIKWKKFSASTISPVRDDGVNGEESGKLLKQKEKNNEYIKVVY